MEGAWIGDTTKKETARKYENMVEAHKLAYQIEKENVCLVSTLIPKDVLKWKAAGIRKDNKYVYPSLENSSDHCQG